jgi:hypothetical protein
MLGPEHGSRRNFFSAASTAVAPVDRANHRARTSGLVGRHDRHKVEPKAKLAQLQLALYHEMCSFLCTFIDLVLPLGDYDWVHSLLSLSFVALQQMPCKV